MTGALGVGDEADEQHAAIGAIRRLRRRARRATAGASARSAARAPRGRRRPGVLRAARRIRSRAARSPVEQAAQSESRAAHFLNSGCSVLSMQAALVAEGQPEDLRRLQFRPLRIAEPPGRRRKDLVAAVFQVGEQRTHSSMPWTSPISLVRSYSFCSPSALACRTGTMRIAPRDVTVR